jgi:hypothetical protein
MEDRQPATNNPQLRRLMNANNSSTRNLPNKVLSSIFELVCVPSEAKMLTRFGDLPKPPRIALASVCSHWHDVVWNTPQLWPTLSVKLYHDLQKAVSTLQMFADNHMVPRSINFTFSRYKMNNFEELLPPLNAFLSQETARLVHYIGLHDLLPTFTAIVALVKERCCNIETLYVSSDLMSPKLSRPKFEFPTCWQTITTLNLRHIPIDTFYDLLFGCQRLTNLVCDEFDEPANNATQPPSFQARVMTFPYLEFFALHSSGWCQRTAWIDPFLQFYRFLSLKALHWPIHSSWYSLELFHGFLSALPISCDSIYLVAPYHKDWDGRLGQEQYLEATLAHVGKIKNLKVSGHLEDSAVEVMWRLLADSTFLPSLERFYYYRRVSPNEPTIYLGGIRRLFQGRKEAGAKSFRLDIPSWRFGFYEWEIQRAQLSRLMNDGSFKVNIYHGHKKLDI